jgi:hypothetical protein
LGESGAAESAFNGRLIAATVTVIADDRITLPTHLAGRLPWLSGNESIEGWLLLVAEGRYRLLSNQQVQSDPQLEAIHAHVTGKKSLAGDEPTSAQEATKAAMVVRLIPIKVNPHGSGWRISTPKLFRAFAPPGCSAKDFTVFGALDGYLEIWYTDVLRKAASVPLPAE